MVINCCSIAIALIDQGSACRWKNSNGTCEGDESLRREVRNDCGLRQAIDFFNFADRMQVSVRANAWLTD